MSERFMTLAEVCKTVCLGKSYIYEAIKRGDFPKPIHLTARRTAWVESHIEAWKAERIAGVPAASGPNRR